MPTYKKGAYKKLSTNFLLSEFDCKGSGCCSITKVDSVFLKQLQGFRDYLNVRLGKAASININSGYRCTKHNARIGGSSTSKHCLGKAADIRVKVNGTYLSAKKVCGYAQDFGFDGIAYINSTSVHVDTRGYKWWADETKGNKQTTNFYTYFDVRREGNPYVSSATTVKRGCKGEDVKWVQWYLYCLRYYTGKIDGKCGAQTVSAIKAFQQAKKLTVDGSCGSVTKQRLRTTWKQ